MKHRGAYDETYRSRRLCWPSQAWQRRVGNVSNTEASASPSVTVHDAGMLRMRALIAVLLVIIQSALGVVVNIYDGLPIITLV
jgi:hypothetical protein